MKKPARIAPWMDTEEMASWVRQAKDRDEYQKRLAVWLTHIGDYHAEDVACLLQVSEQSIWNWVAEFNETGPELRKRVGRGGRRRAFLTEEEEGHLLARLQQERFASEGKSLRALLPLVTETVGKPVSLAYIYRVLSRHKEWTPQKKDPGTINQSNVEALLRTRIENID